MARMIQSSGPPLILFLFLPLLFVAAGCTQAGGGAPTTPSLEAVATAQIVEGTLVAVGSSVVIQTVDEELTLAADDGWKLTRDGKAMNGLELRANLRVQATVEGGKITRMDVLSSP